MCLSTKLAAALIQHGELWSLREISAGHPSTCLAEGAQGTLAASESVLEGIPAVGGLLCSGCRNYCLG